MDSNVAVVTEAVFCLICTTKVADARNTSNRSDFDRLLCDW